MAEDDSSTPESAGPAGSETAPAPDHEQGALADPAEGNTDPVEGDGDLDDSTVATITPAPLPARSSVRVAATLGLVALAFFGGLCGLLGYRLYQIRQAAESRDLMLAAARQAAVNLTTIDYQRVDADVQRILDSAAGPFYGDFKSRSGSFIDVIRKVQSKSVGSVSEAGVESSGPEGGKVLLAVAVTTTNVGVPEERPQYWRMRLTLTKQGDDAKVSEVEFVP